MSGRLAVQSILVSLNTGKYLTSMASLAGLMWFHSIRRYGFTRGALAPSVLEILRCGALHYVCSAAALCLVVPGSHVLWSLVTVDSRPAGLTSHEALVYGLLSCAIVVIVAGTVIVWVSDRLRCWPRLG